MKSIDIENIPTCELCKELSKREGVQEMVGRPYQSLKVEVNKKAVQLDVIEGPFSLFLVYD